MDKRKLITFGMRINIFKTRSTTKRKEIKAKSVLLAPMYYFGFYRFILKQNTVQNWLLPLWFACCLSIRIGLLSFFFSRKSLMRQSKIIASQTQLILRYYSAQSRRQSGTKSRFYIILQYVTSRNWYPLFF